MWLSGLLILVGAISSLAQTGRLTDVLLDGGFTAVVGAMRQVAIEDPLNDGPDMTFFIPSDYAFVAIGSIANNMTMGQLTSVLNYHVVPGQILYSDLITAGTQVTAQNVSLNFRIENDALFVNGARIIVADILIANGIVHIIDSVLNPANTTATPNPTASTQAPAFSGATTTTGGIPFASVVTRTPTVRPHPTASHYSPSAPAPTVVATALEKGVAVGMAVIVGCIAIAANW
ncbi:FAS1 domain-containing protein [Chaetomium sp. MPI-CAGE-AT-0009]|nr:FAS1 domain-containing protein [Chaetomium sp. MPI-CAGE-AT-0009]